MDLYESGQIDRNSLFNTVMDANKQIQQEDYQKQIQIRKNAKEMDAKRRFRCAILFVTVFLMCCLILLFIRPYPPTNTAEAIVSLLFIPMTFGFGLWFYKDYAKSIKHQWDEKHQEFIDKIMMS